MSSRHYLLSSVNFPTSGQVTDEQNIIGLEKYILMQSCKDRVCDFTQDYIRM